jgi:assimilatory nitrate reductase catalytic subunit
MFAKWTDPEAAFKLLRDLTKDRPCDITGIEDYEMIDRMGGIQWPFPKGHFAEDGEKPEAGQTVPYERERRLFEDGIYYTPSGKAKLHFSPPAELPEDTDSAYPYLLLTGRGTSSQWHTQSRTGKSDILRKLYPQEAYIEINPKDAARMGLKEHDPVTVSSRRGEMQAFVYLAPTVKPGQLFLPMHYPEVNRLTHPSFDPHSRQPNYKACAVALKKVRDHG